MFGKRRNEVRPLKSTSKTLLQKWNRESSEFESFENFLAEVLWFGNSSNHYENSERISDSTGPVSHAESSMLELEKSQFQKSLNRITKLIPCIVRVNLLCLLSNRRQFIKLNSAF